MLEHKYRASLQRKGAVYWALAPLSLLFAGLAKRRRVYFQTHPEKVTRLPVPVIVVGNIVIGGTGKTPVVIALVQALRQRGYNPGVIARGYVRGDVGGDARGAKRTERRHHKHTPAHRDAPLTVHADTDPALAGDEPVLIAQRTGVPVVVCPQRGQAGLFLLAAHPEVNILISDDGLQHYALAREVELVLFDARGAGNGRLLPAGPLRETLARPRDATLFVGTDIAPALASEALKTTTPAFRIELRPGALYQLANPTHVQPLAQLAGKSVAAFAGIANPERFFATLHHVGAQVEAHPLPDHYAFSATTFDASRRSTCVITEKDAVKCARLPACRHDSRLWVLPVNAHLPEALLDLILSKISSTFHLSLGNPHGRETA